MREAQRFGLMQGAAVALMCAVGIAPAAATTKGNGEADRATRASEARSRSNQAIKAYQAKDMAGFLEHMRAAVDLEPSYPRYLYNLADAYAMNGKADEAAATLGLVADMGIVFSMRDPDFDSVKETGAFKAVMTRFEKNRAPIAPAAEAFTIGEKGLLAEGLAYDPASAKFFVGSVRGRKVVAVDARGVARDVATAKDGLWGVFGMRVDTARRKLWIATSASKYSDGIAESELGRSAVVAIDIKSGKIVERYEVPADGKQHLLGDLAVGSDGSVYASDSLAPIVYVARPGSKTIERFLESDRFVSLQGLDFAASGKRLYVADYAMGIWSVDTATKAMTLVEPEPASTLHGIDGLYTRGDEIVAVQNGVQPNRIVRLTLDPIGARVTKFSILESNDTRFDDPTLGALAGDAFYFIANGQWGLYDDEGRVADPSKLTTTRVLRVKL